MSGATASVIVSVDNPISVFPKDVPLLPDAGNNCCSPKASGSGFTEASGNAEMVFLMAGPEGAQASVEKLSPSDGGLLNDESVELRGILVGVEVGPLEPREEAVEQDV